MKPGSAPCDYTLDFKSIDFRQHPELYRIGKGEQGVLLVEPYKSEILPHWRFKSVAEAKKSSAKIYKMFLAYLKAEDFPGADMARKFLQMGWTRARRYANHKGGRKYDKKTGEELPRAEDKLPILGRETVAERPQAVFWLVRPPTQSSSKERAGEIWEHLLREPHDVSTASPGGYNDSQFNAARR